MPRAPKKAPASTTSGRSVPEASRRRGAASAKKVLSAFRKVAGKGAARGKGAGASTSPPKPAPKAKTAPPAARQPAGSAKPKATPGAKPAAKTKPAPKPKAPAKAALKPKPVKVKTQPAKAAPVKEKAPAKPAVKPPAPSAAKVPPPAAAKPTKPTPPKPEPPKKPRKPELTPREIAAIKASLEEQRGTLVREFTDIEEGAFNVTQSEMSGEVSFDEEYADAGSFTFEREKELSIGNNIRDLLDKVQHALAAIERGTYGICENCGDPINKARLLALPYSTLCIKCKQQEERTR